MNHPTLSGKYVLVTGIAGSREVFLGQAVGEPQQDMLAVQGKPIAISAQGTLAARPFTTLTQFPTRDPSCQIHRFAHPEAEREAHRILESSLSQLSRSGCPLIWRWIEGAIGMRREPVGTTAANPFMAFHEGFLATTEQFQRVLFQSPQVTTTRELDRLSELAGDFVIELGKVTNASAVKFNQIVGREVELSRFLELIEGPAPATTHPPSAIGAWLALIQRFEIAKSWARRAGKTPLVRELNALVKDGLTRVQEVILDHCSALDTLISEACNHYGIQLEHFGAISPFAGIAAPAWSRAEPREMLSVAEPVLAGT